MMSGTEKILDYFDQINAIPRCSNHEQRLARWLNEWAAKHQLDVRHDPTGNLVIRVPASAGYEGAPTVVIQGHMDMVCEKTPQSTHDFNTDPIISKQDGDWLTAEGTTLGADNGIAIAYALTLAEDQHLLHPPLELLFTVDEESGLNGAKKLDSNLLSGKMLINLDSEDEGVFTVGCAGGQDYELTLDMETDLLPDQWTGCKLIIGGLRGGHSGIDIHQPRGNANKILARCLAALQKDHAFRLIKVKGGSRHNAIARDAEALFAADPMHMDGIQNALHTLKTTLVEAYADTEPGFVMTSTPVEQITDRALTQEATQRLVDLLLALPHGVAGMSPAYNGAVETSCNLATVQYVDGKLKILSSQRSSVMTRLDEINQQVLSVARLAGAGARSTTGYPPWMPDANSDLLARSQRAYRGLFHQDPVIQVIHAGLECAIIGDLVKGMDMISFGPTIENPHSPSERLYLPSVENVWSFLTTLLAGMQS